MPVDLVAFGPHADDIEIGIGATIAAHTSAGYAVGLTSGQRVWYQPPPPLKCASATGCSAALISALTLIPGVLFSGSNDGALRAHSTIDGSVIWEFDTNREFETLNGVKAGGGAIQGPGPTIAGGMLYLNSGYGDHLGRPGNVLLAFEVP